MSDRSIAAPDLATAMDWFISTSADPNLCPYFLSIDHAPSEQIDGSEWHHTAMIISQNIEHQILADDLGKTISPATGKLKQWKNTKLKYRKKFQTQLWHELKKLPLLVLGMSAREVDIVSGEDGFARELGIFENYRRITINEKIMVEFGPYRNSDDDEYQTIIISPKHATMAIYTAAYMLRIHNALSSAVAKTLSNDSKDNSIWMQVWSDKPPNDFSGKYAELMWLLLGSANAEGKFTWGGFQTQEDQPIDILVDNLAGFLNSATSEPHKYQYSGPVLQPPISGTFFWERLQSPMS
ncbi:hypothetical protein [Pseudomonas migulae]|uniref:DUF3800 domain-containing protein n=1 Tax=Pseudomonas migulae TaxID=78543 RepID=A0ABY8MW11_9PSED|nr:hypothetical protein [Pseudomonas migulae]WGK91259.1 hypothetical protein MOQ58_03455 [Pseudomonas migulae]